jgi:hypothetical protein
LSTGTTTVFPSLPAAPLPATGGFGATTFPPAAPATFPAFPGFAGQAPLQAPLPRAGCTCGQFCSANGITGTCQADGFTCAQNILPPQCGTQTQFGLITPRG